MALPNARIIDLAEISVINAGSFLALYDILSGVTYKVKADLFVPTSSGQNFNWVSNYEYSENEVATFGGKWWQSLEDENGGNIPTEGAWWTEVSKQTASSLAFHANGIYTDTVVFVMRRIDEFDQLFRLKSATRPYVSANFLTEWAADDWELASDRGYFIVTKAAHGWDVNTQLTFKTGAWNAFTTGDQKLGIVRGVIDANNVIVLAQGAHLRGMTGLTPGATYYAQSDGTITDSATDDAVMVALSETTALLLGGGGSSGGGGGGAWGSITGTITDQTDLVDYVNDEITDAVVGLFDDRGNYDPTSTSDYPATGGSGVAGAILKGDIWRVSVAGTISGNAVRPGDTVRALVDTPGTTDGNWAILNQGLQPVVSTQNISGAVSLDLSTADVFILTLTGDVTGFDFTNEVVGKQYVFEFLKATTEKTLVWTAGKYRFPFGNAPVLTNPTTNGSSGTTSVDIVTAICAVAGRLDIAITPDLIEN